jgi:hypothetical protein
MSECDRGGFDTPMKRVGGGRENWACLGSTQPSMTQALLSVALLSPRTSKFSLHGLYISAWK